MDLLKFASTEIPPCRSVWVSPMKGEESAPPQRIIHCRLFQFPVPVKLTRIGFQLGMGYAKCGSQKELDWIQNYRLLVWLNNHWECILEEENRPEPVGQQWVTISECLTSAVILQIRKSGIDRWWPSWNISMFGMLLEGEPIPEVIAHDQIDWHQQLFTIQPINDALNIETPLLTSIPAIFELDYSTYKIRLRTQSAGMEFFSLNEKPHDQFIRNLLYPPANPNKNNSLNSYRIGGPRCIPVGMEDLIGFCNREVKGVTTIQENQIIYDLKIPPLQYHLRVKWEFSPDFFALTIDQVIAQDTRLWISSGWNWVFDTTATPMTLLGDLEKVGETGFVDFMCYAHFPRYGSLQVDRIEGDPRIRFDSIRPLNTQLIEIKCGEVAQPEGDYLLPKGTHHIKIKFRPIILSFIPPSLLHPQAPALIRDMLQFRAPTALPFRADTATFSNNGNSMHAPICLDVWAYAVCLMQKIPGCDPANLLRETVERWLYLAPGYASGYSIQDEQWVYEDEYLMTGTNALLGAAIYIDHFASDTWFKQFEPMIRHQIKLMRTRDLDHDGLIESDARRGISGEAQWSTNWFDVISFGWKDAFTNANLYPALKILIRAFTKKGDSALVSELTQWADLLRKNYYPQFYNPKTGWLAGWRCKNNLLHDYAFLYVNGAAVAHDLIDPQIAKEIMQKLWMMLMESPFKAFRLGLPGNLWRIPDSDNAKPQQGKPLGHYENGGATHSQARHFISGLYHVGMVAEADLLINELAASMVDGSAFGAVGTGVDWRYWDGTPCGYEGQLCDQFGILLPAFQRWAKKSFNLFLEDR